MTQNNLGRRLSWLLVAIIGVATTEAFIVSQIFAQQGKPVWNIPVAAPQGPQRSGRNWVRRGDYGGPNLFDGSINVCSAIRTSSHSAPIWGIYPVPTDTMAEIGSLPRAYLNDFASIGRSSTDIVIQLCSGTFEQSPQITLSGPNGFGVELEWQESGGLGIDDRPLYRYTYTFPESAEPGVYTVSIDDHFGILTYDIEVVDWFRVKFELRDARTDEQKNVFTAGDEIDLVFNGGYEGQDLYFELLQSLDAENSIFEPRASFTTTVPSENAPSRISLAGLSPGEYMIFVDERISHLEPVGEQYLISFENFLYRQQFTIVDGTVRSDPPSSICGIAQIVELNGDIEDYNLRNRASIESIVIEKVPNNTVVELLCADLVREGTRTWVNIQIRDKVGWMSILRLKNLANSRPGACSSATVIAESGKLAIREQPQINADIKRERATGSIIELLCDRGELIEFNDGTRIWVYVQSENVTGWMSKRALQVLGN